MKTTKEYFKWIMSKQKKHTHPIMGVTTRSQVLSESTIERIGIGIADKNRPNTGNIGAIAIWGGG